MTIVYWPPELPYPISTQCTFSLPPENIRKLSGFLTFSGGIEM